MEYASISSSFFDRATMIEVRIVANSVSGSTFDDADLTGISFELNSLSASSFRRTNMSDWVIKAITVTSSDFTDARRVGCTRGGGTWRSNRGWGRFF